MRCPKCFSCTSSVKQTTRPLDEGMSEGDVKRRLRKCGSCDRNFTTFEIQESAFRQLQTNKSQLVRQPLLVEDTLTAKTRLDKRRHNEPK